jgi:hypothetical protein
MLDIADGLCFQGADGELWTGTFWDCRGHKAEEDCRKDALKYGTAAEVAAGRVVKVKVIVDE